ncbi:hypothetical protein HKD37_02G004908 [Glycine soja]
MNMASRKRKSTASRPQAQYDTRRFQSLEAWNRYTYAPVSLASLARKRVGCKNTDNILDRRILPERNVKIYHTKFDEFKAELKRFNLHKCLTNLQEGSIDVAVVKELYANLYSSEDQSPKQVRVRGHLIRIDADSLNSFLETPIVLEEGETLPTYSRFSRMRIDPQEFAAHLCIPGRGFVLNAGGHPWKLLRKDLTTLAQTWSVLSYSNPTPTSHTSDLNMDRARLSHMHGHEHQSHNLINSSRLGFPALIIALCRTRGVTSDSLTYESLSLAINLAYINKNCWNMDDLTVNFRRVRKVRARPANAPSFSAPPAPPTSATPTPAAHDSQRFEAMLQRSILSVEQFIEKVSWPGTVPSAVREGEGPSAGVEMRLFFLSQLCQIYMRLLKQVADPPTPVHERPDDPSTLILEIPKDLTTPVLTLNTSPPATLEL